MLLKKITFFTLSSLVATGFAEAGWFDKACEPINIKMERSVGFTSAFKKNKLVETGNDGFKVDIPVTIAGQEGCFTQEHSYLFGYKKNDDGFKGSVTVKAPKFDYEDIEDFNAQTYVKIENKNGPFESQLRLTTFVCAGESVLSVHTFSNRILDVVSLVDHQMRVGMSTIFATGLAAKHVKEVLQSKSVITADTDEFFIKEYLFRTHYNGRIDSLERKVISVPKVILYSNVRSEVVDQTSYYQTKFVNQLGCTKEFANVMREYNLANLRDKHIGQLSVEADADGFVVSWE